MYDDLADHLRSYRLTVWEEPGCYRRGYGTLFPRGHILHHDAIESRWSARNPPNIFRDGHAGLPYTLANSILDAEGEVRIIATGIAYHAGLGSWPSIGSGGNSIVWGTEPQNGGTGQPWPKVQMEAYAVLSRALGDYFGFSPAANCRHAEWAGARKIDAWGPWEGTPWTWQDNADRFRQQIAAASIDSQTTPPLEDHPMIVRLNNAKKSPPILVGVGAIHPGAVDSFAKAGVPVVDLNGRKGADRQAYNQVRRDAVPLWKRTLRVKDAA